jgi:FKBP-type peptidyl-prolyl cis-trans isomerase (trigger factor)
MQVTETAAAGLKREFRVVVPATDLEAKVNARLDDLKGKVQLRGSCRRSHSPISRPSSWSGSPPR